MLVQIQEKILDYVLNNKITSLDFIKSSNGISSRERLQIHRNTILRNFLNALEISFPGTWKLLGRKQAEKIALTYIQDLKNIPTADKMHEFGVNFPAHLINLSLDYLPDFAKLEWFRSLSYDAQNQDCITVDDISKINIEHLDKYKFIFNSSVYFLKSEFDLATIQELANGSLDKPKTLLKEENFVIIYRRTGRMNTIWIKKSLWHFLNLLSKNKSLGEAIQEIENMKLELNLEKSFNFILERRLIKEII